MVVMWTIHRKAEWKLLRVIKCSLAVLTVAKSVVVKVWLKVDSWVDDWAFSMVVSSDVKLDEK
jgi:hypothetical protein